MTLLLTPRVKRLRSYIPWVAVDLPAFAIALGCTMVPGAVNHAAQRLQPRAWLHVPLACCIYCTAFWVRGVYRRMWSRAGASEMIILAEATALGFGSVTAANLLLQPPVSRPLGELLLGAGMVLATALALRYRTRLIRGFLWHHRAVQLGRQEAAEDAALIVGAGRVGDNLVRALQAHEIGWSYRLVGFIDDDESKHGMLLHGLPVLGNRRQIPSLVAQYRVHLIILAMGSVSGPELRDILSICEKTDAQIRITPDIYEAVVGEAGRLPLRDLAVEDLLGRRPITCNEDGVHRLMEGATIAITGAAGSIGSHLARYIVRFRPRRLVVIDINESGLHDLVEELRQAAGGVELTAALCDVTDESSVGCLFARARPQVVFHCAAYKHVPILEIHPHQAIRVNIGGTRCVASAAIRYGVDRFILVSSDKAGRASSVYGLSKLIAERVVFAIARTGGTRCSAVRFGNVLGSHGSVVPTFVRQVTAGSTVTVTHPAMRRYLMTIGEAVMLLTQAAALTRGGDLYMLEMGEDVRIVDLAERIIRLRGVRPGHEVRIVFTGLRPGEELEEDLIRSEEERLVTPIEGIYEIRRTNELDAQFLDDVEGLIRAARPDRAAELRHLLERLAAASHVAVCGHSN